MASSPVAVRLDDPLKARMRPLADQSRRPMHWLIREAIEQYVTRKELRESFRQEALDACKQAAITRALNSGACRRFRRDTGAASAFVSMCPPKIIVDTTVVSGHKLSKVDWLDAYSCCRSGPSPPCNSVGETGA